MTFKKERKKTILEGEVMNRTMYSNVNQAMHKTSIWNQGVTLLLVVGWHGGLLVVASLAVIMVDDLLVGFKWEHVVRCCLNWGRVSMQMITTERMINNKEMILTILARHDDSGLSKSSQI